MAEEEGIAWLNNFGVTSVNPEDIERDLLEEARKNGDVENEGGENSGEEANDKPESIDQSSMNRVKLYNKLKAVEFEIDAVAATVGQVKDASKKENCAHDGNDCEGEDKGLASSSDLNLQHALAVDRLRGLKKTHRQLKKELSDSCEDKNGVIYDLVKEESRPKRKLKEAQKSSQHVEKRVRTVAFNEDTDFDAVLDAASCGFVETEKDQLIRKGILTPFHTLRGFERRIQLSEPSNRHNQAEVEDEIKDADSVSLSRVLQSMSEAAQARPTTKLLGSEALPKLAAPTQPFRRLRKQVKIPESLEGQSKKSRKSKEKKRPLPDKRWRRLLAIEENGNNLSTSTIEEERLEDAEDVIDENLPFTTLEGGLKIPDSMFDQLFDYQKVGVQWLWELHCQRAGGIIGDEMGLGKTVQVLSFLGSLHFSNMYKPSIVVCPVTLLRQWKREAQKWYPSFHAEILHDSAHNSNSKNKRAKSIDSDYESEDLSDSDYEENLSTNAGKWDSLINRVLRSESGLLITTYEQLRILGDKLLDVEWGYAVLDEGHRIRNPNAEITLVCKQLQTVHRIIMTGAPIQNKLTELWSLFDFVFPGKLGVLPVFEAEFAVPISVGGYANASPLQVSTAYRSNTVSTVYNLLGHSDNYNCQQSTLVSQLKLKECPELQFDVLLLSCRCAVVLRDLIMPYLLRRMKSDVNAHLPKKTEHVLFCSLTSEQRSVYRSFLASSEVEQILDGRKNSLYGIDVMRKICNHPDLLEREHSYQNPDYGNLERSGKMKVVDQVLKVWKAQGHRVLLFTQTQQMLDILESFLVDGGYKYRRMDGVTPVKQRMPLIDEFNNSEDVFIFILTTKVGGLGTNLTGADRVIIFDPDWNPSTDMQARERAWRIGQKKDVTVYRLITRGTIEEKVYHRQIYKHFLTNKILQNPQQKRFFKARDMKDLFILNEDEESGSTETSNIFSQLSDNVNIVGAQRDEQHNYKLNDASTSRTTDRKRKVEGGTSTKRKGKEKADRNDGNMDEETNILKSLFDAQGIHSAVNHDIIMNAHEEEKMRLEEQASRVAQRAAEALRISRMCRTGERISIPTWTGKSGSAGAPSSVNRRFGASINTELMNRSKSSDESSHGGAGRLNGYAAGTSTGKALSSAELLAQIRGNQARALRAGLEYQSASASSSTSTTKSCNLGSISGQKCSRLQPEILIRQICTFMQQRGGTSTSNTIVEHFRDKVPKDDLPLFKNLLKEIAVLEKASDGSHWVLKSEYRQQ